MPTKDELAKEVIEEGSALIQAMALYRVGAITNKEVIEVLQATVDKLKWLVPWITSGS